MNRDSCVGIFDTFQTLAEILKSLSQGLLSPSWYMVTYLRFQKSLSITSFPTTKDPRPGKEWICNPFVNEPGESTLSVPEEDQLLEIANDGGLKSMCETTSNLHTF